MTLKGSTRQSDITEGRPRIVAAHLVLSMRHHRPKRKVLKMAYTLLYLTGFFPGSDLFNVVLD